MGCRCGDGIGSASVPDVELMAFLGHQDELPATGAPRLSHGAHPRVCQLVFVHAAGVRVRAVRVQWHRIRMSITVYIYIGVALGLRNQLYIPIHTHSGRIGITYMKRHPGLACLQAGSIGTTQDGKCQYLLTGGRYGGAHQWLF